MTIRKGAPWGVEVDRPADLLVVESDAALAAAAQSGGHPLGLGGGDLHRSLGAPAPRPTMQRVDIDVIRLSADGAEMTAVAHVVARRSWWRGRVVAVMNVDQIGVWNVAPRAHPNDGLLDVVEVDPSMNLRQRWQARGRLRLGTHVPHPSIGQRRVTAASWQFDRPVSLWVDGERRGTVTELSVRVEPDAFELHI